MTKTLNPKPMHLEKKIPYNEIFIYERNEYSKCMGDG
jgi:hypothetical protein